MREWRRMLKDSFMTGMAGWTCDSCVVTLTHNTGYSIYLPTDDQLIRALRHIVYGEEKRRYSYSR